MNQPKTCLLGKSVKWRKLICRHKLITIYHRPKNYMVQICGKEDGYCNK